jgi:hypothetical protein
MIRIVTDLSDTDGLPILPGLETEVIQDPSMINKVVVIKCDEKKTLVEALKLIKTQQTIIDRQLTKVIYINDDPHKHVA